MSHFVERKQNNCLNCDTVLYGRFCHICGQENIEPKESFWHLVTHFIYDITHFDGKFFSSVKYLLLKPGFLSRQYIIGKRISYLNPIRMYVFVSAFFFLFFFSIVNPSLTIEKKETEKQTYKEVKSGIEGKIADLEENIKDKENPEYARKIMENQLKFLLVDRQTLMKDTVHLSELNYFKVKELSVLFSQYGDKAHYDSVQNALPKKDRDGWLQRMTIRKTLQLQARYSNDSKELFNALFEKFRHTFPQLLWVTLPLFALLLKLLYIRRKKFYYVDHIIYSVHLYCAMFILLFIVLQISILEKWHYLNWLRYFTFPLVIYIIWYQYKSMRNFYEQSRLKTISKYLLLLMMSSMVMTLLFVVFLVFSIFNL